MPAPEMLLPAALILLPLLAGIACQLWPRRAVVLALAAAVLNLLCALLACVQGIRGGTLVQQVGGWAAPLGIELRADGLSLVLVLMSALVGLGVSAYAAAYFAGRRSPYFWPLWLILLAAMNALFLSADLFNLYVTLELVGIGGVALSALGGGRDALVAAMRYLLASLLGSLAYLLGVVLIYHARGTVDLGLLAQTTGSTGVSTAAFALMGAGLMLKAALFPFHFWLPPAHASAAAPVSAALSALVVKANFYVFLRVWLEVFPAVSPAADALLMLLGAAAVTWGSLQAILQRRAKLLVAYSTVAQIGYFFLALPLARNAGETALHGLLLLMVSHAFAKAALFMGAGNLLSYAGHDRIAELDQVVQRMPVTAGALALAGVSIMGLPPSGGFNGKWLLLQLCIEQGRWSLVLVLLLGGLMAAVYIFKLLEHSFTPGAPGADPRSVAPAMEWAPFVLAVAAVLLGFAGSLTLELLAVGQPFLPLERAGGMP